MKERPILFTGPMVRAILDGRKTQTRRVLQHPPEHHGFGQNAIVKPYCTGTDWPLAFYEMRGSCWNSSGALKCPYGQPGDRLWVRESFGLVRLAGNGVLYYADDPLERPKWKSGRFMPKAFARIWLEITEIRVQRVQEIADDDAVSEGIEGRWHPDDPGLWTWKDYQTSSWAPEPRFHYGSAVTPRSTFEGLWDSMNSKRGFGWDKNPWVWAITFKRV